jgi:hypothetical protein
MIVHVLQDGVNGNVGLIAGVFSTRERAVDYMDRAWPDAQRVDEPEPLAHTYWVLSAPPTMDLVVHLWEWEIDRRLHVPEGPRWPD